jgi:hypothetical protein
MKTRSFLKPLFQPLGTRGVFTLTLVLATGGLSLLTPVARAQAVDIGVRSKVMDKDLQWSHKTAAPDQGGHSKTFAILAINEVPAVERLVKPVDKENILRQLIGQLLANGFKIYAKGTKPDILLAVSYGRGDMTNPYERDAGEVPGDLNGGGGAAGGGSPWAGITEQTILGAMPLQLYDKMTPGHETNLQKSNYEKLFIRVTAFEYPKDPKAKAKMLWKTIIVADDPDHRDLNAIAAQMLEAGAPYFDKDVKDREIDLYKPAPDGKVNVGTPEVVPPRK